MLSRRAKKTMATERSIFLLKGYTLSITSIKETGSKRTVLVLLLSVVPARKLTIVAIIREAKRNIYHVTVFQN